MPFPIALHWHEWHLTDTLRFLDRRDRVSDSFVMLGSSSSQQSVLEKRTGTGTGTQLNSPTRAIVERTNERMSEWVNVCVCVYIYSDKWINETSPSHLDLEAELTSVKCQAEGRLNWLLLPSAALRQLSLSPPPKTKPPINYSSPQSSIIVTPFSTNPNPHLMVHHHPPSPTITSSFLTSLLPPSTPFPKSINFFEDFFLAFCFSQFLN